MGVTTGEARPMISVTELAVKLVTQMLPEPSMARPWGSRMPTGRWGWRGRGAAGRRVDSRWRGRWRCRRG